MSLPTGITRKGNYTYWKGRPLIWIEGDEIHVSATTWAAARHISIDEAEREIHHDMAELVPDIKAVFVLGDE